jgi:hypothetical protein
MKWSYSKSKTFRRCQRQWFYANVMANGVTKDPIRRRVYLLGKLQTIAGWRGSIVDSVIETAIVPALQRRRLPDQDVVLSLARRLYDLQLATALKHPLNAPERTVKSWGDAYAAFYSMEYGGGPSRDELDLAWQEIENALRNLCGMRGLLGRLCDASQLVAQRSLQFQRFGVSVMGVPDLIAFYSDEAPAILDWKAHAVGTMDASKQLGIYSIALKSCEPHRDFPASLSRWAVESIRLVEVQLLLNRPRRHELDDDDREAVETYMAESANSMLMAVDGRETADLVAEDFPTAAYDHICERCSFRKVCWGPLQ